MNCVRFFAFMRRALVSTAFSIVRFNFSSYDSIVRLSSPCHTARTGTRI